MSFPPVHGIAGKMFHRRDRIYVLDILLSAESNLQVSHVKYKGFQNKLDPGYKELQQIYVDITVVGEVTVQVFDTPG